jgi:hypothetical protein
MRSLARELLDGREDAPVRLVYGTVTALNTVRLDGEATAVPLTAIESVVAGQRAAVLKSGADRLIVGALGGALGALGYAKATADQTGISTSVDLTGLTTTVTVGTGRLIKVTGWATFISVSSGDERVRMRIRKNGNTVSYSNSGFLWSTENEGEGLVVQCLDVSPTAGSHTYKLSAERIAGTTDVEMDFDALRPPFILVEDIGPA